MTLARLAQLLRIRPVITPAGFACLCLSFWGCLAIYNATYHLSPTYWFVGRQMLWIGIGTLALVVASGRPTLFYRRLLPFSVTWAYLALWLVLVYGIQINGMRGWFAWRGVFVQPSELAKPVFVLSLAYVMDRTRARRGDWLRGYLPVLAVFILWLVPIVLQPDFGSALVYGFTFAALYWCMGGRFTHLALSGLAAAPFALFVVRRHPYVGARLSAFLDPQAHAQTTGWHILQFQRALASGGFFGRSWGNGLWSRAYLPLGYSDSIFANTAEAVGFVGVLPIILLILGWVIYGTYRASTRKDGFVRAAILGLVVMLAGQAFIHLSVNLGLLPPTGITLPLISYGGSSLVATLVSVGIVEALSTSADGIPATTLEALDAVDLQAVPASS